MDLYLYRRNRPGKTELILAHPSRIRRTPLPVLQSPPAGIIRRRSTTRPTSKSADRTWLAYCVPTDVYFEGKSRWGPRAALMAGLMITGLIVGYLYLLTGRTMRIEKLVARRTQELRTSEKRFRLLVENAADAFFLHDEEGRILDVNQRGCEQLGYSREELLKMHVFDFEVGFKPEEHHELTWKRPTGRFSHKCQRHPSSKGRQHLSRGNALKLPGNRRQPLDHGRCPRRHRTQASRRGAPQRTAFFAASYRPAGTRTETHGL